MVAGIMNSLLLINVHCSINEQEIIMSLVHYGVVHVYSVHVT